MSLSAADFITGLRIRLDDQGASPRWKDAEMEQYLIDAARDYSKYFPREREQQFTADGTSQRYDVPPDLIDDHVIKVILIDPVSLREEEIPHRQLRLRTNTRFYEVVGRQLVFGFAPELGRTVLVRYSALHQMPLDGSASSIPTEDEDLIYAYCMAAAWQRIGGNDAGLSRWTEGQKRDDSPLIPHYVRLWARYDRLREQKMGAGRVLQLKRARGTWRS